MLHWWDDCTIILSNRTGDTQMKKAVTEITLENEDYDELKIRIETDNKDIAEIEIAGNKFWFMKEEWGCISDALKEICE